MALDYRLWTKLVNRSVLWLSFLAKYFMVTRLSAAVYGMATAPTIAPERSTQVTRKLYPNYKVIVLNDDFNTFEHVHNCLVKYIPGMTSDRAWELTNQVHNEGQAIVWIGPQEAAELYHQQLHRAGLTMAPLEAA
jgi:ATP-dependent Clp protease adaptor protein ClpS